MKPSYKARLRRLLSISAAIIALAISGYGHHSTQNNPHLAFFHGSGETVYVDSMDSRVAMDCESPDPVPNSSPSTDASPATARTSVPNSRPTPGGPNQAHLSCFLISWSDNLKHDDELGMTQREKYIQFGMRRDWVALAGGDSLYASFFRQRPLLDRHLHQWALVFPVSAGHRIDTLVYTGAEASWGKRVFILKRT